MIPPDRLLTKDRGKNSVAADASPDAGRPWAHT